MAIEISFFESRIKKVDRRILLVTRLMLLSGLLLSLAVSTGLVKHSQTSVFLEIALCLLVFAGLVTLLLSYMQRSRITSELSRLKLIEKLEIPQTEITL